MAEVRPRRLCRHCKKTAVSRPRGLCWKCFYNLAVRLRYAPHPVYGRRGLGGGNCAPRLPARPTEAPPGSLAKMKVMRKRLERGELLNHPLDNPTPDPALWNPFGNDPTAKGSGRRHWQATGLD